MLTSILFDATAHKSTNPWFGRGILRSVPTYRAPFSSADLQAVAEGLTMTDREIDRLAGYAAAADRLERGLSY